MRNFIYIILTFTITISAFNCRSEKTNLNPPTKTAEQNYSEGDSIEVSGRLICAHCYALDEENTGLNHKLPKSGYVENCAVTCAKQNYPIAVLLNSPKGGSNVWVIRTAGQTFSRYMTDTIIVKGTVAYKGLLDPVNIKVNDGKTWVKLL